MNPAPKEPPTIEQTREEIHRTYTANKSVIEVSDAVALQLGKEILSQKLTQHQLKDKTIAARKENELATSGQDLVCRIRLIVGRVGFISKRERDKIRVLFDLLDQLDSINSTKES